jgi:hypothetical protein
MVVEDNTIRAVWEADSQETLALAALASNDDPSSWSILTLAG